MLGLLGKLHVGRPPHGRPRHVLHFLHAEAATRTNLVHREGCGGEREEGRQYRKVEWRAVKGGKMQVVVVTEEEVRGCGC